MVLLKSSLIGKPVILGYIPKNLVTTVRAHEEPGHRGPGSIRLYCTCLSWVYIEFIICIVII